MSANSQRIFRGRRENLLSRPGPPAAKPCPRWRERPPPQGIHLHRSRARWSRPADTSQIAGPMKARPEKMRPHSPPRKRAGNGEGTKRDLVLRRLLEIFLEVCAHACERRNRELGQLKLAPGDLFVDVDIGGRGLQNDVLRHFGN